MRRSGRTQFASLPAGFFRVCLEARLVIYHQRKISKVDFSATCQVVSDAVYFCRKPGPYHFHPGAAGHRIIKLHLSLRAVKDFL